MNPLVIGLNLIGHDSCAFTVINGEVYAVSEERFTRVKHDYVFPLNAINWILKNVNFSQYDKVIFAVATKKFENLKVPETFYEEEIVLRKYLAKKLKRQVYIKDLEKIKKIPRVKKIIFPLFLKYFLKRKFKLIKSLPLKDVFVKEIKNLIPNGLNIEIKFYDHHLCHALGAVTFSPFHEAVVITYDGWGDGYFSKVFIWKNNNLKFLFGSKTKSFNNIQKYKAFISDIDKAVISVGHIYSIFTYLLGFTPNSDEGKVEALAAFSKKEKGVEFFYKDLIEATEVSNGKISFNEKIEKIFEDNYIFNLLNKYPKEDIACSVQRYLEDITLEYIKQIIHLTHADKLICTGGYLLML